MHEMIAIIRKALNIDLPSDPDTPLISSGLIDSFRMAELVSALESRYYIDIDISLIGADNFDTVRQMSAFVAARMNDAQADGGSEGVGTLAERLSTSDDSVGRRPRPVP
jgi:acyl carrier protein